MAIIYPSAAIARRWDGALRSRLRRAPLEEYLRARSIAPAPAGLSQHSDNVARATVILVESGIAFYVRHRDDELTAAQRSTVGQVACVVSRALAELIGEPGSWRVSALVSTARLLSPWIGLSAAALASASAVRQYQRNADKPVPEIDHRIARAALATLTDGGPHVVLELSASIALRLSFPLTRSERSSAHEQLEVQASGECR